MRLPDRKPPLAVLALAAIVALLGSGCNDANEIAGPATLAGANVSGTWAGTYQSNGPCAAVAATATLQQEGSQVSGIFKADSCGIAGAVRGTVQGNSFVGSVNMLGCTGGAISGTVSGGSLTLSVGDFYKELVTGDREVLPGGAVTLRR